MNNPIILGITAFNHDSSACIIKDSKLIAFSEEERFDGVKHSGAFPSGAIKYCLKEAECKLTDVTDVAFFFNPWKCITSYLLYNNPSFFFIDPSVFFRWRFYYELLWLMGFLTKSFLINRFLGEKSVNIHFINHHQAHTWYGFYASNFNECVVLSNDSVGERVSSMATKFEVNERGDINTKDLIIQNDPNSLGYLYGAITEFLGYERGEGEGRVMALSSFGTAKYINYFKSHIKLKSNGKFSISRGILMRRSFQPKGKRLSNSFYKMFGNTRSKDSDLTQKHYDIARAVQSSLEDVLFHQLDYITQFSERIVLVGGVAQNSVANGKIANQFKDKQFVVPPVPHDAGCSMGAAVYLYYKKTHKRVEYTDTAYLGPDYSNDEIIKLLENNKIKYRILKDTTDYIVDSLKDNKIIAVFRGKMECGPRALCNRSILASPISTDMKDRINATIKYRESFRPYGGFILTEKVKDIFEYKNKLVYSPYMSFVYDVIPKWIKRIPALIHVDNTTRVQIVENDSYLQKILEKFEKETDVPILINTSLNLRGDPIVNTPVQALQTFFASGIDSMIFNESILIQKDK